MEDVLAVYTRPHDPDRPLVCVDETSKQLIAETRVPIPMKPGRPARFDYEYERNGTANLFMMFAPLEGWRHLKVTDRHTDEGFFVGNAAVEALGRQDTELGLRQIEPTAVLWSVMPFEALDQPPGFGGRKGFVE